jgi:hypothetical protein
MRFPFQGFLRAASGKITPIKPMGAVTLTTAQAINAAGTIVGFYFNASSQLRGFLLRQNGSLTTFALPPGAGNVFSASAINAKGAVTGYYFTGTLQSFRFLGFLRETDGTLISIAVPGAKASTMPSGINAAGTIVGTYRASGGSRGFVRTADGTLSTLDTAGALDTFVTSINDAGTIAGSYVDDKNASHGFLRIADGTITTYEVPATGTILEIRVVGIDPSGNVVGNADVGHVGGNKNGAFLRSTDGTITFIEVPGAESTFVSGIDSQCVIAGDYTGSNSTEHGFLRLPPGGTAASAAAAKACH